MTTERTQVYSGDGPVAERLIEIVRSITRSLSMALHDMSAENLALFVAGDIGAQDASGVPKMRVDGRCEDVILFDGVFFGPSLTSVFFAT